MSGAELYFRLVSSQGKRRTQAGVIPTRRMHPNRGRQRTRTHIYTTVHRLVRWPGMRVAGDSVFGLNGLAYPPRETALALLRAQLDSDRYRAATSSPAGRARLRIAYKLGIPVVELRSRTGMARQTVYNAIKRPVTRELEGLAVLALIAGGAAQTITALVKVTGADEATIMQAVVRLRRSRHISVLAGREGLAERFAVLSVAAEGLAWMQTEIDSERLRSSHEDAWTIFIAIAAGGESAVATAAERVLAGDGSVGVIDVAVAPSRMRGPELAVVVRALDSREAFTITHGVWARLRHELAALPALPEVVAVLPPRP
jgi:hypothetical protein